MKKGIMGIKFIIAISLGLAAASAQAATNSWIYTGGTASLYFWDEPSSWSSGNHPTIADFADFITNVTSKTVTIDDFDTTDFTVTNSLTVSNLTVAAPANTTNTLFLKNMRAGTFGATLPLRVLKGLIISSRGVLQISNSFLRVDEPAGTFQVDGTLLVHKAAKVQARTVTIGGSAVLEFALGTNSSPVVVSNNLTVAGTLNIIDGGGFTTNTYTLFTYVGALTNNGLTVGTTPSNAVCVIDTNTSGQVNLIVNGFPSSLTPFQQWQLQYFNCTNLITCPQVAGDADPDGDGMSNTNEFLAGFNPTNNAAYLHVISIVNTGINTKVTYLGANGDSGGSAGPKTNVLEFTTGTANGSYSNNLVSTGQTNILSGGTGLGVVTNMVDTGGATNTPSRFYRVRVLVP